MIENRKNFGLIATVTILLSALPAVSFSGQSDPMKAYFKRKKEIVQKLHTINTLCRQESEGCWEKYNYRQIEEHAEKELNDLLIAAIGKPTIAPAFSSSSAEIMDGDFGTCVDGFKASGLSATKDVEALITDIRVVKELAKDRLPAPTLPAIANDRKLRLNCDNATETNTGVIQNVPKGPYDEVYAYWSLIAQDIGQFSPNNLIVFVRQGTRLYVFRTGLEESKTRSENCEKKWNPKPFSGSRSDQEINTHEQDENECFRQEVNCYKEKVNQNQFQPAYAEKLKSILALLEKP